MARKLSAEALQKIHYNAVIEFDAIQEALRDERLQCLQDRRFYSIAGAQWEGPLGAQFENKPKFEVNKVHLAVIRIFNEYRKNRITVNFAPKDGSKNDDLADTCKGLYRATEQDSVAEEAYDNAFEEGVGGGFGAWRLRACEEENDSYEDDEDESEEEHKKQCIRIEPIFDADSSVFFDLNAKRQDKSDAKACYVLTSMTHEAYKDEYDELPSSLGKVVNQVEFDWLTPDVVYIAEYYKVEKVKEKYYVYEGLAGDKQKFWEQELNEEKLEELRVTGYTLKRSKTKECKRVHKYIIDGTRVIEDCGFIAGKNIPIVPFYGKRWFVDNVERCMGHVRLAKDISRIKNMQLSKLGEISALSAVEKPIFTPEQISGHGNMWARDNIDNNPYLLINPITDLDGNPQPVGPIAYTKPPSIPPAMAALLELTEGDMRDILGNQQQAEEMPANTPGITMELVQDKLDMQSFIYISNMAKAVKRSGEIWLSMAKEIFVEPKRKMKTIGNSGEVGSVELMRPIVDEESSEQKYENDLSKANFEVAVEIGPTSSSKRSATVRKLTQMMTITQDPDTLQVLGAMAMMNMEGEGISEVRDYFRKKLLRMGVVKPTDDEAEELAQEAQNQQPDAQTQFLQAEAAKSQALSVKAQADTALAAAKTEETKARVIEILSGVDSAKTEQILRAVELAMQAQPEPASVGIE